MKLLFLSVLSCSVIDSAPLINGKPINCDYEAYNCPSYRGSYGWKRLQNCSDVETVWNACQADIHDLDRDGDKQPCQNDCPLIHSKF